MSIHSSTGRHPDTKKNKREGYTIGDLMVFEICDHTEAGVTFALKTIVEDAKPLFSGHVCKVTAFDLRRVANRLDELADKI